VTGGKTLILFFDEGKLRKCTQKDDKEVEILKSTSHSPDIFLKIS
jgi:hypothetical protein